MIKRKLSGEEVSLPIVRGVPIQELRYSEAVIRLPVKVGAKVTLIFSERSLDNYLESGKEVLPDDPRRFDLQDAFIIPGFHPDSEVSPSGTEDAIEIENNKSKVFVTPDSVKASVGSSTLEISEDSFDVKVGGKSLISTLKDFQDAVLQIQIVNPIGPHPLVLADSTKIAAVGAALESFS